MQAVIAGAGEVGFRVARDLITRGHDVVIIDNKGDGISRIRNLDAQVIIGNAASPKILMEKAGIAQSDLFIGVCGSDEVNLICCTIAHKLGCKTIARINNAELIEGPLDPKPMDILGIDYYVNPDKLALNRIWQIVDRPQLMTNLDQFSAKDLHIMEARIDESSPIVGRALVDVDMPAKARIVLISRESGVSIANPDEIILPRDRLMIIIHHIDDVWNQLSKSIGNLSEITGEKKVKKIFVAGTSRLATSFANQVAEKNLENPNIELFLVEEDKSRADEVSGTLPDSVTILNGSSTDRDFLREEGFGNADLFISATEREDLNVLSCLMAKQEGAKRTAALVYQTELEYVVQNTGVDIIVNPRRLTVSAIINQATKTTETTGLEHFYGEDAVIREVLVKHNDHIGKPISNLNLPKQSLLAVIKRKENIIFPDDRDTLKEGDKLLIFTLKNNLKEVESLFT